MAKPFDNTLLTNSGVNLASLGVSHAPEPGLEERLRDALAKGNKQEWNKAVAEWRASHPENSYIPIYNLTVTGQKLDGFNFQQVAFDTCTFKDCSFRDSRFDRSHLTGTRFINGDFTNVSFNTSFLDHTTLGGRFENFRIYDSIVANCAVDGQFKTDGKNFNAISYNRLVTCTDITANLDAKEPATLDLEQGALQFKQNRSMAAEGDRGVFKTTLVARDAAGASHTQNIADPKLGNDVKSAECAVNIGDGHRLTDYSVATPKEKREQRRENRGSWRSPESVANVTSSLYDHGVGFGSNGFVMKTDGIPLSKRMLNDEENPRLLSASVLWQKANFGVTKLEQGTVGITYAWTGGGKHTGVPTMNYETRVGYTFHGEGSFIADREAVGNPQLPANTAPREFDAQFKAITPSFTVGTWFNDFGVEAGVNWPVLIQNNPSASKGKKFNPDGVISDDTYRITTQVMKVGPSLNATLKYNLSKYLGDGASDDVIALFARGELFSNTTIRYTAESTVNGHSAVNHGLKQSLNKPVFTFGATLGF